MSKAAGKAPLDRAGWCGCDNGITKEATIWCMRCPRWDTNSGSNMTRLKAVWRRDGWTRVERGWACPECSKELAAGQQTVGYRHTH